MAASAAIIGKGTLFGYSSLSGTNAQSGTNLTGTNLVALSEILDVKLPGVTVDEIDITHMTSDNSYKEFAPGWFTADDLTVRANYLKAQTATVDGLVGTSKTWKITLPDTSYWYFTGWLKVVAGEAPLADRITADWTFKITGKPTFVAAS
jgi:hypothetical protein